MGNVTHQTQAIFGDADNNSVVSAEMLSAYAESPTDWGSVLANGIRGAAQGAIGGLVQEQVQNGNLKYYQAQQQVNRQNLINLLLVCGAIYLIVK